MTTLETLLELAKTDEGRMRIRVMVAELVEWKPCPWMRDMAGNVFPQDPPDYTRSLDAMAEVEKTLAGEDPKPWHLYRQILFDVAAGHNWRDYLDRVASTLPNHTTRGQAYAWASPLHRAIAFILTRQGRP